MIELAHPEALALLILPLLMRFFPAYRSSKSSIKVPFFDTLLSLSEQKASVGATVIQRKKVQQLLLIFMWLCFVIAAAKPEWVGDAIEQQRAGRDLMIAVDLSNSMQNRDFSLPSGEQVDRLSAAKAVLAKLASERGSDRLGLIVFGSAAYLQSPFTEEHTLWLKLLEETAIGMAGQSTVFGDAIGLSIKLFRQAESDNRVLIILSDGNDTGSVVPPIEAAKVAANFDIRIYTIAMGNPDTVGEEALDSKTLKRISAITGGRYFQALDTQQLIDANQAIADMEPELYESISFRPRVSLHWVPIVAALVAFLTVFFAISFYQRYAKGKLDVV